MTAIPNGPSRREFDDLKERMKETEKEVTSLKEWRAQAKVIASLLGFVAGLFSAAIATAIIRALGFGS